MPEIQANTQLTAGQLLRAAEQMSEKELDGFVEQVVALRARHRAPSLSKSESDLLLRINQGVPRDLQQRYDELIAKRREGTITQEEYEELLRRTNEVEAVDVARLELLVELARLRGTTLPAVMEELGLKPPPYA